MAAKIMSRATSPIPVDDSLKSHPYNKEIWKKSGKDEEYVTGVIEESGEIDPILVHKTGKEYTIISGHTRVKYLKAKGIKEVQAIVYQNLTPQDVALMVVTHNCSQFTPRSKIAAAALWICRRYPILIMKQVLRRFGMTEAEALEWENSLQQAAAIIAEAGESGNSSRATKTFEKAVEDGPEGVQKAIDKSIQQKVARSLVESGTENAVAKRKEKFVTSTIENKRVMTPEVTAASSAVNNMECPESSPEAQTEKISKITPEATPPQSTFSATKATATLASFAREISTSFNGDANAAWAVNHLTALFNKQPLPPSPAASLEARVSALEASLEAEKTYSASLAESLDSITQAVADITTKSTLIKSADINEAFIKLGLMKGGAKPVADDGEVFEADDDALPF